MVKKQIIKKVNRDLPKITHEKRTTIRSLSQHLGVSRGTTFNLIKQGVIKKKTSHLKPALTDKQKKERLNFCLQQIDLPNQCFSCFNNLIHIDEKWFFMKKDHLSIYSLPDEPALNRKAGTTIRETNNSMEILGSGTSQKRFQNKGQQRIDPKEPYY